MKFERNKSYKKYFLCGLISVVVLIITVTFIGSKANYRMTAFIPLTEGKVVSSPYDFRVISMYINNGDGNYIEQEKTTLIPSGDYTLNSSKSYCYKENKDKKNSNVKLYTDDINNHVIKGISKGDRCILYFDKNTETAKTMNELLSSHFIAKSTRKSGTFNQVIGESTYGTIYESEDDDGTTYYFVGNPLDNWVEFGGYYWRIIRINGDGSIRMIYQGRTQDANGKKLEPQATGEETQISTGAFNDKYDSNAYVGFMYGTPNSSTYEATHENGNNSTIKQILDNWFASSTIKQGTSYFNKIDLNAGFCGDRTPSTNGLTINNSGGIDDITTLYASRVRLFPSVDISLEVNPTFKCINNNDLYTYKDSTKGNKALDNPVGMINADEAGYAGLRFGISAANNYLKTNLSYRTISPSQTGYLDFGFVAQVVFVDENGQMSPGVVNNYRGIRPVINLRSDVTFTGDGTISNPYKVNKK
ncbi:MAG: hypothetical protein NC483_02910 [Ruminococcus sp.]|nr:hypothetical protein [Ruminococcus sp.]